MEVRSSIYGTIAIRNKKLLENFMGLESLVENEERKASCPAPVSQYWDFISATNAVITLYVISFILWYLEWRRSDFSATHLHFLPIIVLAGLIAYSVRQYWQRWRTKRGIPKQQKS